MLEGVFRRRAENRRAVEFERLTDNMRPLRHRGSDLRCVAANAASSPAYTSLQCALRRKIVARLHGYENPRLSRRKVSVGSGWLCTAEYGSWRLWWWRWVSRLSGDDYHAPKLRRNCRCATVRRYGRSRGRRGLKRLPAFGRLAGRQSWLRVSVHPNLQLWFRTAGRSVGRDCRPRCRGPGLRAN